MDTSNTTPSDNFESKQNLASQESTSLENIAEKRDPFEQLKQNLELRKLNLEIAQLSKPWWHKQIPALVTAFVAVISLLVAWNLQLFDIEKAELRLKKTGISSGH